MLGAWLVAQPVDEGVEEEIHRAYSTAVAIIFGLLFLRGVFHDSIPLLYFCPQEVSLDFRNGGGCSGLNVAMALKRWRL